MWWVSEPSQTGVHTTTWLETHVVLKKGLESICKGLLYAYIVVPRLTRGLSSDKPPPHTHILNEMRKIETFSFFTIQIHLTASLSHILTQFTHWKTYIIIAAWNSSGCRKKKIQKILETARPQKVNRVLARDHCTHTHTRSLPALTHITEYLQVGTLEQTRV